MALNALLKTKERHTHRQWILSWLEDNYECRKGATICKAAVFSDYAEVCRLQTLKPVTNSLFGKLVKAVFPAIRTCRKGPRSDSRTHYAGLHRRRDTISLPRVCPETGEMLPPLEGTDPATMAATVTSFIPAPSSSPLAASSMATSVLSSEALPLIHSAPTSECPSVASSSPSSPCTSYDMSPVSASCSSFVEASGSLPVFHFVGAAQDAQQQQAQAQPRQRPHSTHLTGSPYVRSRGMGLHKSLTMGRLHHHRSSQGLQQHLHQQHQHLQHHLSDQYAAVPQHQHHQQHQPHQHQQHVYFSPSPSLSAGPAFDDALAEFEMMDINDQPQHHHHHQQQQHHQQLPMPPAPPCLCPSCGGCGDAHQHSTAVDNVVDENVSSALLLSTAIHDEHESSSLESVVDMLGDLEPLNFDPAMLHHFVAVDDDVLGSSCFNGSLSSSSSASDDYTVPAVPMSSAMMAPPVAPSPPASPPPPLSLMAAPDFGAAAHGHGHVSGSNNKLRPFLRRTMAQAAEGNPLVMGMINTCQKIIAQKRRRKSVSEQLHQHQHQHQHHQQQVHASKKPHVEQVVHGSGALVPPFVLSLDEIPGSHNSFALQESVLVFANEYRKMYQAVFDRLVRFEYAILFDLVFSFWSQVKLQPNFAFILDQEPVRKQLLAYDAKVLHALQEYFLMNPLKMSAQQFGGYLQTIAFHLPFSVERATASLLPADLCGAQLQLLQTFAADLQGQAQSLTLPHVIHNASQQQQQQQPQQHQESQQPQQLPAMTVMEINNY